MTKGQISSRKARQDRKEIKRTVPTGQYDPLTGKPIKKRMSFYGKHKSDLAGAVSSYQDYLRSLLVSPEVSAAGLPEGTMAWYLVERVVPLKAEAKPKTKEAIDLAGRHLSRHVGGMLARDFRAAELAKLLAQIEGSASLKNKVRNLALEINEVAAEEDPEVRLISRKRVKPVKQRAAKLVVQTPAECLATALSLSPEHRVAALFQACYGLRSGESVGPLWSDVTPIGTLKIVRQEDEEGGTKEDLKNDDSVRELPIPAFLLDHLEAARAAQRKRGYGRPGDPISVSRVGTPVLESSVRRAVKAARKRLDLPPYPGRPCHIFRHSLATFLQEEGCPDAVRMAIMGHAREDVKLRYVHVSTATMLPWIEKWATAALGAEPIESPRRGGAKVPATGARNGKSRISDVDRAAIPERLKRTGVKALARELGVTPKAIRNARAALASTARVVAATTPEEDRVPQEGSSKGA